MFGKEKARNKDDVYFLNVNVGKLLVGTLMGRDEQGLKILKSRIEQSAKIVPRSQKITSWGPCIAIVGPGISPAFVQATRAIKGNDLVFIPCYNLKDGSLEKVLFRVPLNNTALEMLEHHYEACKVTPVLESALICDLTINLPIEAPKFAEQKITEQV